LIEAAAKLDIGLITTFIGRDQYKTIEENIEIAKEAWTPIIRLAEKYKVKVAIENCPMFFTEEQWPGGHNLMTSPSIWRKVFELIPSDYLGLAYDLLHIIWSFDNL